MVKLTISLPNNTQITIESEDAEVIREALGLVLRDLPPDARIESVTAPDDGHHENGAREKGNDATEGQAEPPAAPSQLRRANGAAARPESGNIPAQPARPAIPPPLALNGAAASPTAAGGENGDYGFDPESQPLQAREDFTAFCQSLNPMGDMRRVVVAAEAASRFFGLDGVTADDLGELFDLAGWRRANSFTQTVRNAARSKFGWLERIPGRAGRYAATDLGRATTLES